MDTDGAAGAAPLAQPALSPPNIDDIVKALCTTAAATTTTTTTSTTISTTTNDDDDYHYYYFIHLFNCLTI